MMRAFALVSLLFGAVASGELVERRMPSLIVPLNSFQPDKPQGTQKKAFIERGIHTEVSFDVPSNNATNCRLMFYISTDPQKSAPWQLWGTPPYTFNILNIRPTMDKDKDTWNHHPETRGWAASVQVTQTGAVQMTGGIVRCAKGEVAQYLLTPGGDREFGLNWFQLKDPLHGITYEMYS